ncbi:MAG: 5-oxoprolinase subunit PxpA [Balneolaceae bacterium]
MNKRIDLNCDLGEWKTNDGALRDEAIMPFISSCNIACGGHIGDEESMRYTIQLARKFGVSIGAHPSYPDIENFGRVVMNISPSELKKSLEDQLNKFTRFVKEEGGMLHHIKPHGALYNHAAKDKGTAEIVISAIKEFDKHIPIYLPSNSVSKAVAVNNGLKVVDEVFADRAYEDDLSLRSRKLDSSILEDEADVISQLQSMIFKKEVLTYSGKLKSIKAETVCLHSDTNGAIHLAKLINEFLRKNGVEIISA